MATTSPFDNITATTVNKVTITTPASGATLTILNGKTLGVLKSINLDGTDSTTMTFPSTSGTVVAFSSVAQGDLVYALTATTFSRLAKDTNATRYLSNQGTSNAPSWNQINLANGVTGTLPIANGGTGQTSFNKVRVQQVASPAQSIATATFTKVNFGTKNEDGGNNFASGTYTAPRTGHLMITGGISWQIFSGAAAQTIIEIYRNGSSALRISNQATASGAQPTYPSCAILSVTASDTIEIYVYQNSGSSQNLETGSACHLEIAYLP